MASKGHSCARGVCFFFCDPSSVSSRLAAVPSAMLVVRVMSISVQMVGCDFKVGIVDVVLIPTAQHGAPQFRVGEDNISEEGTEKHDLYDDSLLTITLPSGYISANNSALP